MRMSAHPIRRPSSATSNMKTIFWIVLAVAVLLGAFLLLNSYIYDEKQGNGIETVME